MDLKNLIRVTINDIPVLVPEGSTILDAAKRAEVYIPTLCHLKLDDFAIENKPSSCRVCMVEVEGRPRLCTACSETATDGMVVSTNSQRALRARRTNVELLLSNHPQLCLTCAKNMDCELQKLAHDIGCREITYSGKRSHHPDDETSYSVISHPDKCIMCRRCETMCNEVQTVGVLSALDRGFSTVVRTAFHLDMTETSCTKCGQCVAVCPTGALTETNCTHRVWRALQDPSKHVVVQVAPAVRVALGEMFGMAAGTISTGKICTALRKLGFDGIFDTDWAADLTIMEEASEIVHRLSTPGSTLPILTSCCPAWVYFVESQFPDMLDIPSTCKSPQIMFGTMAKTYYAEQKGLDPKDIVVVSIMPCLAKKSEARRPELMNDGMKDVDIVVTTREFGHMLIEIGLDLNQMTDSNFDSIMGESTGASIIFGTTGGVIEAALRTASEWITGEPLKSVELTSLRGFDGIREGTVTIGDRDLHVGIAHGLGNARRLLEGIRDGEFHYDAIEIMACPGGCIGGGGQPYHHGDMEILLKRQQAIYREDRGKMIRKSHENPMIKKIYDEYLGEPYGPKAHELLHTTYTPKPRI
ncbi:MAG: 4Fe-4S dicluster domain-containing protein [Clostridia bacterium]|nr:4Fe-4S dicluster domain-containing protein [Clostridia bacterium]NLF20849.1 4Fe-4S dicluster domain-containing protein [Clostridiaceae bacterium]